MGRSRPDEWCTVFSRQPAPVQQLFDWLADGVSLDEFVADFQIDRQAAETVLRVAGASFATPAARASCRS